MFSMLESFNKSIAIFIFKFCSKRNGVNGGGKRGHEKKGRAFSEIKSFKDNHMFVITSIKGGTCICCKNIQSSKG
jgi:hypothetical protein